MLRPRLPRAEEMLGSPALRLCGCALPACLPASALQVFGNLFAPAVSSASKKAESAAKAQELKQAILRLSANKDNGVKATPAEREEVLRLAKELAKLNQASTHINQPPSHSSPINRVLVLMVSGAGGGGR